MLGGGRKKFFFEKKNQKTFGPWGWWQRWCQSPRIMGVFLLLFLQKKKCLLSARAIGAVGCLVFARISRFWIAAPLRGSQ
jgi:hypothetical protein